LIAKSASLLIQFKFDIHFSNQPALSKEDKVSCLKNQQEALTWVWT